MPPRAHVTLIAAIDKARGIGLRGPAPPPISPASASAPWARSF